MSEIAHAPTETRMSRFFWIGLLFLCVGTGPLLIVIVAAQLGLTRDPNPNPVGFGILALFTFWPGVLLMVLVRRDDFVAPPTSNQWVFACVIPAIVAAV